MVIGQIVDQRATLLAAQEEISGNIKRAAFDGRDTVHLVGRGIFAVGIDGNAKPPAGLPAEFSAEGVVRGADGDIYFYGESGIAKLERTSSTAKILSDFRHAANRMYAVSEDLVAAFDEGDRTLWTYDGSAWNPELSIAGLEAVYGIGGDEDVLVVYGKAQLAYVRKDRTWTRLPEAFASGHFRDLVGIGQGRFIVVASSSYQTTPSIGRAAIWSGSKWCELDVPMSAGLEGVDVSPDGRTAYLVGNNNIPPANLAAIWHLDLSGL